MTSEQTLLNAFGLRAQPFEPSTAWDGTPIDATLVTRTLNPLVDERLTGYYFDVYDYDQRSAIRVVLKNRALSAFPNRATLRPVLFFVTGTGQSGRGSMVNLCLHAIDVAHREPASEVAAAQGLRHENRIFVVESSFSALDVPINIRQIAEDFARAFLEVDEVVADKITALIATRPVETVSSSAPYKGLFSDIRARLPKTFTQPVALVLSGYDSFDFWPAVYDATEKLVDYIIVDTVRDNEARVSLDQMRLTKKNASLVSATELDRKRAEDFLDARLDTEAIAGAYQKVHVVAPNCLDPLYELGRGARSGQVIRQPIGWLKSTLQLAFHRKFTRLIRLIEAEGLVAFQRLPLDERRLTREDIEAAREDLNQGLGV